MPLEWANVSTEEIAWTLPALLAFSISLGMFGWVWSRLVLIERRIREKPLLYRRYGPRWNFLVLLVGAMLCFTVGWLGYVAVGILAMMTPPPVTVENQESALWFAALFIGMEMIHAGAQGFLWAAVRALAISRYNPAFEEEQEEP